MAEDTDGTTGTAGTAGTRATPEADRGGGGGAVPGGHGPESSDSLRTFGAVVQALREHAGLSREDFAARVRYSKHTVASVEQGRRMPDAAFAERAEEALGNTGALRSAVRHLARQPGLAAWFRQWARLERTAISLYTYECRVVPGLLQTEGYARALSLSAPPLPDEDELNQRIAARMARHELLSTRRRPLCAFSFIVEQAVLERHTGGEQVSRELLDHLLDVDERHWNVEVQVMPLRKTMHAGLDGPMRLLETAEKPVVRILRGAGEWAAHLPNESH